MYIDKYSMLQHIIYVWLYIIIFCHAGWFLWEYSTCMIHIDGADGYMSACSKPVGRTDQIMTRKHWASRYTSKQSCLLFLFSFQFFLQPLKTRFYILDSCKGFTCWFGLLTFALFPSISWNEQQVSLGEVATTRVWKVHFLRIFWGRESPQASGGKL